MRLGYTITPQEVAYREYVADNLDKWSKRDQSFAKLGVRPFVKKFIGKKFTKQDIEDTVKEEIEKGRRFFANL